ncbi:hypothetical protein JCM10207_005438 [Rhodosporidiobolus poonsookiae]
MPVSDSAQPQPECAVCPNKGLLRCTGCRPESTQRFCSRECMKLIWPGHKGICGKDPSAVCFPPLTTVEQAFLRANRDKPVYGVFAADRAPLLQLVRQKGLWMGSFEELVCRLGQAESGIAEPARSRLIAFCRRHRCRSLSINDPAYPDPWLFLADDHLQLTESMPASLAHSPRVENLATPSYNPFKELSAIYHQLLILDTLLTRKRPTDPPSQPPDMKRVMFALAFKRLLETIEHSSLKPAQRWGLRAAFTDMLAVPVAGAMDTCAQ